MTSSSRRPGPRWRGGCALMSCGSLRDCAQRWRQRDRCEHDVRKKRRERCALMTGNPCSRGRMIPKSAASRLLGAISALDAPLVCEPELEHRSKGCSGLRAMPDKIVCVREYGKRCHLESPGTGPEHDPLRPRDRIVRRAISTRRNLAHPGVVRTTTRSPRCICDADQTLLAHSHRIGSCREGSSCIGRDLF